MDRTYCCKRVPPNARPPCSSSCEPGGKTQPTRNASFALVDEKGTLLFVGVQFRDSFEFAYFAQHRGGELAPTERKTQGQSAGIALGG
jgi:hypothetical protein